MNRFFNTSLTLSFFFFSLPVLAMDYPDDGINLFKQTGKIQLTVEETIPDNCPKKREAIDLLKSTTLTAVKTAEEAGIKKEVGFTFPSSSPWCLLTAKYIKSLNFRPNLGDWGCGHGFFLRHALISGANPYAIDSSLPAAQEANRTIFSARYYIPEGLDIRNLYKASNVSVITQGSIFMKRKNHINVAFNVIQHLDPLGADQFFNNLSSNTMDNGIVVLSCDTPFDINGSNLYEEFYNEGMKLGIKYAGYGVYSKSTAVTIIDPSKKLSVCRKAYRQTADEERDGKFKMGQQYRGIYPLVPEYDNGDTIPVNQGQPYADILQKPGLVSCYSTCHQAFNKFKFDGLKNVLELAGFNVLNGWYTSHNIDTLYPHDEEGLANEFKTKLVIVAQKNIPF